jgi:hypothetical protein
VCGPTPKSQVSSINSKIDARIYSYLDLQQIITANTLVVHLVVGIVRITATLILNEGEAGTRVRFDGLDH